MGNATVGEVLVPAKIENLHDLFRVKTGDRSENEVRRVEVTDALEDTGAFGLLMPMKMIEHLGLVPVRTRMSRTISGEIPITTHRTVRLTIQGRDCVIDVSGIADHLPVIIGQIPLEAMDWVVNMRGQRLIGNRDHNGEDMVDIFAVAHA